MVKITKIFIVSILTIIGAYDIYAIYTGGNESSISNQVIVWSYEYPAFTFLIGFCMGHLFWRMKSIKKE